ncbi:transmembrane protein [Legionella israelensis]|uniref:Probable membrane transporter protein n=2 Tax=Legionella israelensis TaxID=454 RepID=A0A0W0WBU8_9GAMM|nr:sulfite exporter TauE/SafE family protein [Legionella israelensis]KTD29834.1 transmembrane protein [Legionella israelensis]QBS11197.1 sulfite exporter TauE/SafE family protein [Legionella israelensis]SCY53821.1 Sulfite exporter TauE/SafE [Legionella israelensis DSM 19235]STX61068.1 transmembrane protein [Legionella israelensis]
MKKENPTKTNPSLKYSLIPMSMVTGCLSTLLGIGGGTIITPMLQFFNYPLRRVLAISVLNGLFIGGIGSLIIIYGSLGDSGLPEFSLGYVNWMIFILIAPTAIIGSPLGVWWANRLSKLSLEKAYTVFLVFVLGVMIYHLS